MTVTYAIEGGVTQSSAIVTAKITGTSARLAYDTDGSLPAPTYTAAVTPTTDGIVTFTVTGLASNTAYFWAVEDTGVLDSSWRGTFTTFPTQGSQASFTCAVSSCAGLTGASSPGEVITSQVSNHSVFTHIRNADPLFFSHLGDAHYRNISTNTVASFRTAWNDFITYNGLGAAALQGTLYRNVPLCYVWDDHDFGADNSDRTSASNPAVNQVYRERMPAYELPSAGVYQAWQVGRVQFLQWDTRTFRDPNSDPQSADKTMLGIVQRDWTRQVLTTTTAEFLVVLNPTPWLGTTEDKWAGFADERELLADMFVDTGWSDRMIMICGDRHALAIDSGANNDWGGFPSWLAGGLDSPSNVIDSQYDLGFSPGRGRWVKLDIVDSGDQISVTGTGMIGSSTWRSHTVTITVEQDTGTTLPTPGDAAARTDVTWLLCDLVSGAVIDEAPDTVGPISRVLGAYSTSALAIPLPQSGPAYRRNLLGSTEVANTMLVAVVNDRPSWAGTPWYAEYGSAPTVTLGTSTLESYLLKRVCKGLGPYTQVDTGSIIARNLLLQATDITGVGTGIGLLIDAPPTGVLKDHEGWKLTDRKTIYDCLTELMDDEDGIEWTIDLEWADSTHRRLEKIVRVRERIGTAATAPGAVFETTANSVFSSQGSSDATYTYRVDFTADRGANYIVAYSSGQDDSQPASDPVWDLGGRPIIERHFQPATDIRVKATLDRYARAELARRSRGTITWDIATRWDVYPRLNLDWALGDDVAWNLAGPGHPDGVAGQGRVIGWNLNIQAGTVQLILQEPE